MKTSELGPISPDAVPDPEKEVEASWIVRKLAGSITGRVVRSSYESLKAAGTSVVCLSPWGDSSPLLLPCIRFRDLVMHAVIAGTGGTAAIAAPIMGPMADFVGDSIVVEIVAQAGFKLGTEAANDLIIEHPLERLFFTKGTGNDKRLETTAVKTLTVTLKHKSTVSDASLGFFRSSVHRDSSLFSNIKDYLAIEKGWMSPVLFASNRRPIIPRSMTPDVVFCHGPFLGGDYRVAQTLLNESATVIALCGDPSPEDIPLTKEQKEKLDPDPYPKYRPISNYIARKRKEKEVDSNNINADDPPPIVQNRRLLILVLGIKPHRTDSAWSTSLRPDESIIRYMLLNGCPALIIPVKPGCPLIAWDTMALASLYKAGEKAKGVAKVLYEYLALCVDWDRVDLDKIKLETQVEEGKEQSMREGALRDAVEVIVAGAVKSGESAAIKELDTSRAGIAMLRMP